VSCGEGGRQGRSLKNVKKIEAAAEIARQTGRDRNSLLTLRP
jgi:hypothetical protein